MMAHASTTSVKGLPKFLSLFLWTHCQTARTNAHGREIAQHSSGILMQGMEGGATSFQTRALHFLACAWGRTQEVDHAT